MDQATDERTMQDLELHIKKAESHLNLYMHLRDNGAGGSDAAFDALVKAHDRVCKAHNTFQFIKERYER